MVDRRNVKGENLKDKGGEGVRNSETRMIARQKWKGHLSKDA
jgi:hypothetical protein